VSSPQLAKLIGLCQDIALADSAARRDTIKRFDGISGALAEFAAELAATNSQARETVLVIAKPSAFAKAAADSNSIEIFDKPPTASDLVAVAAGDELSNVEYLFARMITGKDFIQLRGFSASDDQLWSAEVTALRNLYQQVSAADIWELIEIFDGEPIVELAVQIATALSRKTPVIIDGSRALLAASIIFENSVAARSWLFVVDTPRSSAGGQIFKHRNWISLTANQVATGDGLSAIAGISLARTAALLLRS
jgi:hypothetical protein